MLWRINPKARVFMLDTLRLNTETYDVVDRIRQKYGMAGRFAIYVGRIDENKGCKELFEFFKGYLRDGYGQLSLLLVGQSLLPIPQHPRIRHLGFLDDTDKFDAMAAADLLIVPSYFESLSMVALEAWALGRPVMGNAGLSYQSYSEFLAMLQLLEENRALGAALGENGRRFFREHYEWPVIERKYLDVFERLTREPARPTSEPLLPPWFMRRRRTLPPGEDVMAKLPRGAAVSAAREPVAAGLRL